MRHLSILIFTFFVATYISKAQTTTALLSDTVALDEVQVTAARYPQNLRSLAAPLQIISSNQLQRISTGDLSAALASVPGVQLQSATFQTQKLTLRGVGSRSQYGTNRTRVYIDDIPLTGGDGTSVFDDVELSFLSRAEITKGSYSAWYGSGMGGTLRFVSRKATDKRFSSDFAHTSSGFGFSKFSGMAFAGFDKAKLSVGISRLTGDGYRQNSAFARTSGLMSGEFSEIKGLGKISYLLMLSNVHAFTPSSIDESTFLNNPQAAAANWLNVKGFKSYERLLAGLKFDTPLNDSWSNTLLITTNVYDQYELRPFNILDDKSSTWSVQESLRFATEKTSFSAGFEVLSERYKWQTQANNTLAVLTDAFEMRTNFNAFVSADLKPLNDLHISLGANLNFTHYKLTENIVPDRPTLDSDFSGKAIFSPMLGVVYQLSNAISLYGSAGHGFSNPTVEESLNSDGRMNKLLRPEQGWTFDVGVKSWFADARISLQASAYAILLQDLLITMRPQEDVFYGENAGSSVLKGLELSYKHQVLDGLTYSIAGSVSDHRFLHFVQNDVSFAEKQLPGIPVAQLYSDVLIDLPLNFNLHAALRYNGSQFANDANEVLISDWKTIDISLRYEYLFLKKIHLQTQITVNNLFDEHYASMILINAPSFGGRAPRYYYPAMPRNFAFTMRLRWE